MSHARLSQIEAGDTTKRETIDRLARALVPADLPPDEAEESYRRLLGAGLSAAGFAPDAPDGDEYDDNEDIAYLRGLPPDARGRALKMLKAAFDEEDAKDDAGNIGKRAE